MILQELQEYYNRKAVDSESSIAPEGFESKEIPFILVLDEEGDIVNLECTYEGEKKAKRAKVFLVPQSVKKTSGIEANLMWENPEYALGIQIKSKDAKVHLMHEAFKKRIKSLGELEFIGFKALNKFLEKSNKKELLEKKAAKDIDFLENLKLFLEKGLNISFRLNGEKELIVQNSKVIEALNSFSNTVDNSNMSVCLVTGTKDLIKRLHPSIKGVWGTQSSGGNIVSFNLPSSNSYCKEQGYNAPVGKKAVFAYTTALNQLLRKDSQQRIQVGDATAVFWSAKENSLNFEQSFAALMGMSPKDNPDRGVKAVSDLFESIKNGVFNTNDGKTKFYVLGLSPNVARISIKFWINGTIQSMAENIAQHFDDLKIVKPLNDNAFLSLFSLLVSTAVQGKSENILPNLSGDLMRAILDKNSLYPRILLQIVINRIKADHKINYSRMALVKAYLNRLNRKSNNPKEEITVSIDNNNTNIGYCLGRLFATLEKIQEEAMNNLNSTILDRFYGAASSTPASVFATLMKMYFHHLNKMGKDKEGRRIYFEKLVGEILSKISNYPSHLSLENQGLFSIGYYHQRRDFFTKKEIEK